MPMSAAQHGSRQDLAVLTRANHDMRSPLSVILGVFELLEDSAGLTGNERRYVHLGARAAEDLLSLADSMRLYSAMERNLVTLDSSPVNAAALLVELSESILGRKDIDVRPQPADGFVRALADFGYLKVALTHLLDHLAAHLPDDSMEGAVFEVCQRTDDDGRVTLQLMPGDDLPAVPAGKDAGDPATSDELGVLNGIRLIEMMGGAAALDTRTGELTVTLPAA